jgi:hypothetical protein
MLQISTKMIFLNLYVTVYWQYQCNLRKITSKSNWVNYKTIKKILNGNPRIYCKDPLITKKVTDTNGTNLLPIL